MNTLTHYHRLGGETKVRELVDRFYDHMDELPEAWGIRKLHAESLDGARQKLFDFLSGWMGGPQHYVEKHGHPMLRRRHLPFPIGEVERDQWMHCMRLALDEVIEDEKLRNELYQAFVKVADHMRNQAAAPHFHQHRPTRGIPMYAHTVELSLPIDQAIEKLKAILAEAKMGVVSEVDVQAIMKAKINHEIPPYRLLGVCAPGIAKRVIEADKDAGALLPCGCCVYETAPGVTRIALQDPGVIAATAGNTDITAAMNDAQSHLAGVLAKLRA